MQLSVKEFALIQRYPVLRKISNNSPLFDNKKLVYHSGKKEHAQLLGDCFSVQSGILSDPTIDEEENVTDGFLKESPLTGEMKVGTSGEDQLAVTPDPLSKTDIPLIKFEEWKDTFTFYELLQTPQTEVPFLVENLIPAEAISILSGDSDAGKSSLYQQLALAIILGLTKFLGLKINPKFKRVLLVNTEDTPVSIKVRLLMQLNKTIPSDEAAKRLTIMTVTQDVVQKIESKLKEEPVDLVVIDAYSDVFNGDTRSDNASRLFLNQFIDIIRKYKCAVLFVHHIGKTKDPAGPNKDSLLGSVAIHGKARSVLLLSKQKPNPMIKILKIAKGNYVSEEVKKKEIFLEFDPETLLHREITDTTLKAEIKEQIRSPFPVRSRRSSLQALKLKAKEMRENGSTLEEIGIAFNRDKATISRWLKDNPMVYNVSNVLT
jgi:archaellum biogenesis ATPase FlaH